MSVPDKAVLFREIIITVTISKGSKKRTNGYNRLKFCTNTSNVIGFCLV